MLLSWFVFALCLLMRLLNWISRFILSGELFTQVLSEYQKTMKNDLNLFYFLFFRGFSSKLPDETYYIAGRVKV